MEHSEESAPWRLGSLAVIDTETTGLFPDQGDRIVELGVVLFDGGVVTERWGVLINPERELPADITRLTGITPEDVAGQPRFAEVADRFLELLVGRLLVAYNVSFDQTFLVEELARAGRSLPDGAVWLDPMVFAMEIQQGQGNHKLGTVASRLEVPLKEAHRAKEDAECAGWVLLSLADKLPGQLAELLDLQERWGAKQEAKRAVWQSRRRGGALSLAVDTDGPRNGLGPSYPHGKVLDPVRYMFLRGTGRL